ncbi:MAG: L-2-hydroxyglutarate oxidase [Anaerolineae bacterium]|nr:L-2-hydroxyglutarate oxidase [Anaerolineae bacterium]
MTERANIVVVGGGIVGLATARELLTQHPDLRVVIVEKEAELSTHQTGHNSGVIHSGIYYKPGSLKAKVCVAGHRAMLEYCDAHHIPYRLCGKVIIAVDESEIAALNELYQRGLANGVQGLELVDPPRLREIEPHVVGVKAIYSPNTGIVDYRRVARAYADDVRELGGQIITGLRVSRVEERGPETIVRTTQGDIRTRFVITCAGLYSDRISGDRANVRIVPFRGSYYRLSPESSDRARALIYPVPDPRFPFLGVHFTRTMDDEVLVGPNAVLAFAREGYTRWHVNFSEMAETLMYPGFWKLAKNYWKMGALEMYQDFVKAAYVKTARRYIPELSSKDFLPGRSGVRAQALDRNGVMVDDFRIKGGGNVIHVQNAPSPAATSSLIIAQTIAAQAQSQFGL